MNEALKPGFGVYIHWPFCASKCPYCDFNSHVRHNAVDQRTFVEAYAREIEYMASLAPERCVTSIFFGGGTPSLMEPQTVEKILESINNFWSVSKDAEISLEANPTSVEAARFKGYRDVGVNRVSLGIQSLDDKQLQFLGRLHTVDEAKRAIETAQNVFANSSFDLIYARPGQSGKSWERELREAIGLSAGHLSLYQLTIEEGTRFFDLHEAGKLTALGEDPSADLYELTHEITSEAGYERYEISNHALPGQECKHNLVYWRGEDYAGIGPGAHGRLNRSDGRIATSAKKSPEEWWQSVMTRGHGLAEQIVLLPEEAADEFLLMGLRLAEGIQKTRFETLSGHEIRPEQIGFLENLGLIESVADGRIRATQKGFLVLDAVVADLAA